MNPKILGAYASDWRVTEAGLAAFGLHCLGIAWLGANESATHGVVPARIATGFGSWEEIDALVAVGLWEPISRGDLREVVVRSGDVDRGEVPVEAAADGWFIPDYLRLNQTREERELFIAEQRRKARISAEKQKAAAAERQAEALREQQGGANGPPHDLAGEGTPSFGEEQSEVGEEQTRQGKVSRKRRGAEKREAPAAEPPELPPVKPTSRRVESGGYEQEPGS